MKTNTNPPAHSRRDFLKTSAILALAPMMPRIASAQAASAPSLRDQLGLSKEHEKWLKTIHSKKLIDIAPIVPAPAEVSHLGWPVATRMSDGRFVVVFTRSRGHGDSETEFPAGRYATASDNLRVWHPKNPYDKRARVGDGSLHCIAAARRPNGGERVVVVAHGAPFTVHVSDDRGESWRPVPGALDNLLDGAAVCGPRLITHPEFGIVAAFGQQWTSKPASHPSERRNWLARSLDAGGTWEQCVWENTKPARSVEPALATWGPGHMVMVSREFVPEFAVNEEGYYCHTQHVYRHEKGAAFSKVKFTTDRSNIICNPVHGTSSQDTAEVIYNPVTRRIECIQSHRLGGGGPRTGKVFEKQARKRNSVNLWSIDPDELLAGSTKWRFECTLIEREGYSRIADRDGMHPGGSIVDEAARVQHIFFYAGWRRSPSSIFLLSRSLDTPALAREWKKAS